MAAPILETGSDPTAQTAWTWRVVNALAVAAFIWLVWSAYRYLPAYEGLWWEWVDGTRKLRFATLRLPGGWDWSWLEAIWPVLPGKVSLLADGRVEYRWANLVLVEAAAWCCTVGYVGWYLGTGDGPRKPFHGWCAIGKLLRQPVAPGLQPEEHAAVLNLGVKAVFVPLMCLWLPGNFAMLVNVLGDGIRAFASQPFTTWYVEHLHWILWWTILSIDVLYFTIGYLVEHPRLGNVIRTVEPTALGWFVCLLCYPALVDWSGKLLGWYASDLPQVRSAFGASPVVELVTVVLGLLVIALMGIYAWASAALGLKASNLTNRGTVARGPYRWIRHPAYVCKTTAWNLTAAVPLTAALINQHWSLAGAILGSMAGWTFVYHLRALTEERHLSADPEYRAYCAEVRWRYVPGLV